MSKIKIAHLSDPHFASITYNLNQFLSKRWLGNTNLICFRNKTYQTDHLTHIPNLLSSLGVDAVCITGDFTTTSLDAEYERARAFVDQFKELNLKTFVLPGNHDVYTRESERSARFHHYFPSSLEKNRIEVQNIAERWWYIGLDCALATGLVFSNGKFFDQMQIDLEKAIASIPPNEFIIIANHFPLFSAVNWRHGLVGAKKLTQILKRHANIKLYLHGHDHVPYIVDKVDEGFPLVLNSGSVAHLPKGSFYMLELSDTGCLVEHLTLNKDDEGSNWSIDKQQRYAFRKD